MLGCAASNPHRDATVPFQELLNHPAVQAGIAPFIVALVVALALHRIRLGGLAAVAGFATAVGLIAGFNFEPLTATRKLILLGLAAPVLGLMVDFAFKPTRIGNALLAVAGGLATIWVFLPVLRQKEGHEGWLLGAVAALVVAWLVASSMQLSTRPVRNAASGLALGLGAGALGVLGASASYGQYGIALGAGAGALLLVLMLTGKAHETGATFSLSVALTAGLLVAATMILAQLPWYAAAVFALVPMAAMLPGPDRAAAWVQALAFSLYAAVPAVAAGAIVFYASRGS